MLRLKQSIIINKLELPFVETVTVKTTRNDFTETAEITIQNKIPSRNQKILDKILIGSEVIIQLGYHPNIFTEFTGYVSQVIPEKVAVIRCENEAYYFKRRSIGKDIVLKSTTAKALIDKILEQPNISNVFNGKAFVVDANLGDFRISKSSTLIDVLAELQSKYKLYCYFRGVDLIVGASEDPTTKKTISAHFQKNVPIGESSYNFKDASADQIVVKTSAINRAGEITEVYAYYSGGNSSQDIIFSSTAPTSGAINEFNINGQNDFSKSDLENLAKIRLEALSFTGVDGSITIYGPRTTPGATHGDLCKVTDLEIPEKDGTFSIVEVIKRFGVGIGYRQDLGLGITV